MPNTPMNIFSLNRSFNPNAQFTVGNLVAFADAAGSAPTDGTGGAPTVTIARTLSSPLDGIASFLFTKDAANRQGEGFSFDVVLQPSDATKPFNLSFDYQISTGTYTGYQNPPSYSDLTLWFYDVTNAVMYQMQGYQLDGAVSTTNQYSYQGSIQIPVGCLQGRVIWFLGNTGASAFTAKFNNISFGREPRVQGSVNTPLQGLTIVTDGFGTLANFNYTGARNGAYFEIQGRHTNGTVNGNLGYWRLPAGLSTDTSIGSTPVAVGYIAFGNTTSTNPYQLLAVGGTNAFFYARGEGNFVPSAGNATNTGELCILAGRIPIQGWAPNGTLGQDADTRVIAAQYAVTGNGFTVATGADRIFSFDTKIYDTAGLAENLGAAVGASGTFGFRIPVSGVYDLMFSVIWAANGTDGNVFRTQWLQNGVFKTYGPRYIQPSSSQPPSYQSLSSLYCRAGDLIQLALNNDQTQSITGGTNPIFCWAEIKRKSGPAQVQAPEVISGRYNTNAGQSIANGGSPTIIDFEDRSYDDHMIVTTGASWKITAPRAGRIRVSAQVTYTNGGGWASGEQANVYIYKNGNEYAGGLNVQTASHTNEVAVNVSDEVDVVAGDTIDIRTFQSSGAALTLSTTASRNFVSFNYVGGITQ